jgi:xylulose-5-phosphate/fructose-6-phosphate phosphoketolase
MNRKTMEARTLTPELLRQIDAYWRAANYLSVGQIDLYDNLLLKRPLTLADVKHMLLGHWGTTPGQNFIYVHLNRVIKKYDLDMIYISGPRHGGPAVVGKTYLEGTYSEIYPDISQDEAGLRKLFLQFSFPGGIPSHPSPECPGSILESGELGYSLSHAFGAVFDNPDLVVGDGEVETGPLATAWHSNKFLDPITDGAVPWTECKLSCRRRASAGWAPIRTPMAACCSATWSCRTFGTTRWRCHRRDRCVPPTRTSSECFCAM